MQQLIIKLSPQATENYLKIASMKTQAEMEHNIEASGIQLDINVSMLAGLHFADIDVNGQSIKSANDDEDLEFELVEVNWVIPPQRGM